MYIGIVRKSTSNMEYRFVGTTRQNLDKEIATRFIQYEYTTLFPLDMEWVGDALEQNLWGAAVARYFLYRPSHTLTVTTTD